MAVERVTSFEDNAEVIVKTLHGKVPPWAAGAYVDRFEQVPAWVSGKSARELPRPQPGSLTEAEKCWFEDATFEDVGHTGIGNCDVHNNKAYFSTWRRPSRAEVRRFCAPTYPKMLATSFSHNQLTGDEPLHCLSALIKDNYRIISLILGNRPPKRLPPSEKHTFVYNFGGSLGDQPMNPESFQATLALRRRYEWTVAMSLDGTPALRFMCSPGAARAAFRLRDLPPGKSRRDALIHWVAEHYRNPDIHVSEHLRGKHVFEWRGLQCQIIPSAFDREKEIARKARPTTARASRGSPPASR